MVCSFGSESPVDGPGDGSEALAGGPQQAADTDPAHGAAMLHHGVEIVPDQAGAAWKHVGHHFVDAGLQFS
jgi:hypothetical protein